MTIETQTFGGHEITLVTIPGMPKNVIAFGSGESVSLIDTDTGRVVKLNRQQAAEWLRELGRQAIAELERALK